MTTRRNDPKYSYRVMCLGMRRVPAVLGQLLPNPKQLTKTRLIALLGFAYALGADDCAETAARMGTTKRPPRRVSLPPSSSNVVPFARRARDRTRPL